MTEYGPPTPLDEDALFDLLRRNLASSWIEPLLADPTSRSVLSGIAAIVLRLQDAGDEAFSRCAHILTAPGAARATTTVRLYRSSGALVTLTTERFVDERGAVWRVVGGSYAIPLSGVPQTVDVPIETERVGHWLNFSTPLTFQALDSLPDPGLAILASEDPAEEGATPALDQHGLERGVPRNPSELDEDYAHRLRFLDGAVSPADVAEGALRLYDAIASFSATADLVANEGLRTVLEPFEDAQQPRQRNLYRTPSGAFADSVEGGTVPATYSGGDGVYTTFADDASGHWIRSFEEFRAWFDVFLPTPTGTADEQAAAIASLAAYLDRARAGGVGGRIVVGEPVFHARHAVVGSLSQAGAWTDHDGSAADADLVAALEEHDASDTFASTGTGAGSGSALAGDDLVFELPALTAPAGVSRVELFAWVRRTDLSVGVDPEFQFVFRSGAAGAAERVGSPRVVDHDEFRLYREILEQEPNAPAAWAPGDVSSAIEVGVANVAAVGATDRLDVSELYVVVVVDRG